MADYTIIEHWNWVYEVHDIAKIQKLEMLTNPKTFWDDVRKYTKRVTSDHSIRRWEILSGLRAKEIGA